VIYAEGEDERVLRARRSCWRRAGAADPGRPPLGGRGADQALRPAIKAGQDFDLINPEDDPRYRSYVQSYRSRRRPQRRHARCRAHAGAHQRHRDRGARGGRGEADAMICGVEGRYMSHLRHVRDIIGFRRASAIFAALALMITSKGAYFIADTQVRPNPSAEELAEMASLAAIHVQRFGIKPKIALRVAFRLRQLRHRLLAQDAPRHRAAEGEASGIEADGEMQGDTALSEAARKLSCRIRS
jgi:malate dehydrogenase (oxaloacetate-decarboxylating)(NADP+)